MSRKPDPKPADATAKRQRVHPEHYCPACGTPGVQQKCKVVCPKCRRIILTCSEF